MRNGLLLPHFQHGVLDLAVVVVPGVGLGHRVRLAADLFYLVAFW
jgi:hypothetical protein